MSRSLMRCCWLVSFAKSHRAKFHDSIFLWVPCSNDRDITKVFSANLGLLVPGPVDVSALKIQCLPEYKPLYRIFSRALRNFASSGDCNFCLIFPLKWQTVVTLDATMLFLMADSLAINGLNSPNKSECQYYHYRVKQTLHHQQEAAGKKSPEKIIFRPPKGLFGSLKALCGLCTNIIHVMTRKA